MDDVHNVLQVNGYSEGYAKVMGYWIFYKSFGDSKAKSTIVCLHGGPGATHDYILPFARLSEYGYRVVFYDQLGCGKSQQPQNLALYTVERYVEELETLRRVLDLGKVHLWGQSWGGFLNVAYTIKYSQNLKSLMPSSGSSSVPLCKQEMSRLRSELPKRIQETLDKWRKRLATTSTKSTCMRWTRFTRCTYADSTVASTNAFIGGEEMVWLAWLGLQANVGPNEFCPVGTITYWDVTNELHKIQAPTLITCGKYDEVTSKNSEVLRDGIKDSKLFVFEDSSHSALLEEPTKYLEIHRRFLRPNRLAICHDKTTVFLAHFASGLVEINHRSITTELSKEAHQLTFDHSGCVLFKWAGNGLILEVLVCFGCGDVSRHPRCRSRIA